MKRTAFIAFSLVVFVYLVAGSIVFHFIEGGKEKKVKQNFAVHHDTFLHSHTCLSPEDLNAYVLMVLESQANGIEVAWLLTHNTTNMTVAIDDDLDETNWDFASAFLFCLTLISTIGYGSITPKTSGGQLFCIFYALCGIPLFATCLVGVGERLQIPLKKIQKGKKWYKKDSHRDSQLKTAVFLSTGILLLIFIPSASIANTEHWSFVESLYFCIITLTTVGFGDYVPGQDTGKHLNYLYRLVLAVWIIMGLSWIALILSELASVIQSNITRAARSTQSRLGDLEDIVKKKARETRERIAQKASNHRRRSSSNKDKEKPSTPERKSSSKHGSQRHGDHGDNDSRNHSEEQPRHRLEETRITGSYQKLSKPADGTRDLDVAIRPDLPGTLTEEGHIA